MYIYIYICVCVCVTINKVTILMVHLNKMSKLKIINRGFIHILGTALNYLVNPKRKTSSIQTHTCRSST